jgi:hypothetical protein
MQNPASDELTGLFRIRQVVECWGTDILACARWRCGKRRSPGVQPVVEVFGPGEDDLSVRGGPLWATAGLAVGDASGMAPADPAGEVVGSRPATTLDWLKFKNPHARGRSPPVPPLAALK